MGGFRRDCLYFEKADIAFEEREKQVEMGEKVCIFAHLYFFLYLCSGRSALSLPIFGSGEESPGNTEHHAG